MSNYVLPVSSLPKYQLDRPSSPADALAKLASCDKAWITYLFCLGSLALCILLGAGQATAAQLTLSDRE